jgi:glutamine amidotransferase
MIAIINYGLGNLHSVRKAVFHVGGKVTVTEDVDTILGADKIILPGVGAFSEGMRGLGSRNLVPVLQEKATSGTPLLGICLGMQLLFEESEEKGHHRGLGLISGKVVLFREPSIKIPQIGWNQVQISKSSELTRGINSGDFFYFNHGYYCAPEQKADMLTRTDYGGWIASAVERENIFGVQFHPEKSQQTGLNLLKNFVEL